ncbi:hypothetical protein [Streptomyces sp. NPDC093970]|uniref:hypothetical protein n=1 Tax=Streptomyces sp. NPDC093970 TaxID=3155076 RepID=UPI00343283D4
MTATRYARVLGGAAALVAGLSGCAYDTTACAGVGVVAHVGVFFAQEGYGDLAGASVRLCANGRCVEDRLRKESVSTIDLPLPDDIGRDLGTVRFRVTPEGGTTPLVDASAHKKLDFQSDQCGGGAYNGGLAFTKEGGLTAEIPKSVSKALRRQIMDRATGAPVTSPSR